MCECKKNNIQTIKNQSKFVFEKIIYFELKIIRLKEIYDFFFLFRFKVTKESEVV